MADYIDRQAAIAALKKMVNDCHGSTEAATAAAMAISVISQLPGPWVSVDDRPPERDGRYWCSYKLPVIRGVTYRNARDLYYFAEQADPHFEGEREFRITHWMPLPDAPEVTRCES